jgi:hypothetical protein
MTMDSNARVCGGMQPVPRIPRISLSDPPPTSHLRFSLLSRSKLVCFRPMPAHVTRTLKCDQEGAAP